MIKKVVVPLTFLAFAASSVCYSAEIVGIGDKCLDVKGGGSADGTKIILWPCKKDNKANQRWVIR
jgi:hypothetical protein